MPHTTKTPHPFAHLRSVGPATCKDFDILEVYTLEELAASDPQDLYNRLCRVMGVQIDICQYDVFCAAIAQAQNPNLPEEQKDWSWWSKKRKACAPIPGKKI